MVSAPVSKALADQRRRKAKKENKGRNPSKEFLEQQDWSIFIVTFPKEEGDFSQIFELYTFRWRIEIIFKSWKSNMGFSKIHNVSTRQLHIILISRFIMILLLTQYFYTPCRILIQKHLNKNLSLMKTTKYLTKHLNKLIEIHHELSSYNGNIGKTICTLATYCSYDSRQRTNYEQTMNHVFA